MDAWLIIAIRNGLSLFFTYNCHLGKEYERSADLSQFIMTQLYELVAEWDRLGVVCLGMEKDDNE